MPFATHGGLAVRHAFPLDGEYVFKHPPEAQRHGSTIDGIDEDEHEIELRVDHALSSASRSAASSRDPIRACSSPSRKTTSRASSSTTTA